MLKSFYVFTYIEAIVLSFPHLIDDINYYCRFIDVIKYNIPN